MDTHTCTNTRPTTPEFPQGGADSGSLKTAKWPDNKEAQLDEVRRRMDLLPENMPVWVCGFVSGHTLRAVTLPSCFLSVWIFTMRTERRLKQGFFSSCLALKEVSLTEGFPLNNNSYDLDRPRPCLLFLKPETTRVRLMFKMSSGWTCFDILCEGAFTQNVKTCCVEHDFLR